MLKKTNVFISILALGSLCACKTRSNHQAASEIRTPSNAKQDTAQTSQWEKSQPNDSTRLGLNSTNSYRPVTGEPSSEANSAKTENGNPSQPEVNAGIVIPSGPEGALDKALAEHVRTALRTDTTFKNMDAVQVRARKGVVTLNGNVKTEADRQALVDKVQTLDGVTIVKNELKIGARGEQGGPAASEQGNGIK